MKYPQLEDRFFESLRPNQEFFQKWEGRGPWGPKLMPVYEWEGILYVACAPSAEFSPQPNWFVVQADPDLLCILWEDLNRNAPTIINNVGYSEIESSVIIPDLASVIAQAEKEAREQTDFSFEDVQPATAAPQTKSQSAKKASDDDPFALLQDVVTEESAAEKGEVIETLDLSFDPSAAAPGGPLSLNLADLTKNVADGEPVLEHTATVTIFSGPAPVPMASTELMKPAEEPLKKPAEVREIVLDEVSVTQGPAKPATPIKPPPPPMPAPITAKAPPPPPADATSTPSRMSTPKPMSTPTPPAAANPAGPDYWSPVWSEIKSSFEHGMILLFKDGNAIPWKWDPALRPEGSSAAFSLQKPSPFRIVARTQKPYHGYLVQNEVSDQFFKAWNKGKYPGHLTMSPILEGEIIKGFLMAWGSPDADTKEALQLIEKSAKAVGQKMTGQVNLKAS